jgi:hypothetical protein
MTTDEPTGDESAVGYFEIQLVPTVCGEPEPEEYTPGLPPGVPIVHYPVPDLDASPHTVIDWTETVTLSDEETP